MRPRALLLSAILLVTAVACADIGVRATQRQAGTSQAPASSSPLPEPTYEVIDGVVDFGEDGPQHPEYDGFLTAAFKDIEDFWAQEFPATYGSEWAPLEGGIYAAYPGRRSKIPGCGTPESTYEDVQAGTAFYCIVGDFMAYDDADGLPALVDQLGKEAVGVVLAHEFGHAIQARADEWDQPGVLKEQQADCFAGAWTAHVASGASDVIRFDDADIRAGLVAMINVRDPIEVGGLSEDAHGTGFDRVGAFQDGFEGGAARCKTFFTEGRLDRLVDIPFEFRDPNQGNLPLVDPNPDPTNGPSDIITLIPASLKFFWTDLAEQNSVPFTPPELSPFPTDGPYPQCDGVDVSAWKGNAVFCAADNTIHWDRDVFEALAADPLTGDMSVGYLLSNAYSDAVQSALRSNRTGESRALFSDCLTGAWVGYIVPPVPQDREDQLVLSAGDLDEAIITAIDRSDERTDTDEFGSAFEKVDAFRTGVLGGLNVCRSEIP